MGKEVTFDYSKAAGFVSAEEMANFKTTVMAARDTPVSYTHLDVYKRQPDEMRKALDETAGFDMITRPNKGYDPATHNLLGLEFTIKAVKDGEFETLGKYAMPGK